MIVHLTHFCFKFDSSVKGLEDWELWWLILKGIDHISWLRLNLLIVCFLLFAELSWVIKAGLDWVGETGSKSRENKSFVLQRFNSGLFHRLLWVIALFIRLLIDIHVLKIIISFRGSTLVIIFWAYVKHRGPSRMVFDELLPFLLTLLLVKFLVGLVVTLDSYKFITTATWIVGCGFFLFLDRT